jgi:hypothetical protein
VSVQIDEYNILEAIKDVIELSKLSMSQLRRKNRELERAYNGPHMTREQLIFQIVFLRDAPCFKRDCKVKYGRDHSGKITVQKICQGLRDLIDKGASSDELCDYIDDEFIQGAYGHESISYYFLKDFRGLLIEMYKGSKDGRD